MQMKADLLFFLPENDDSGKKLVSGFGWFSLSTFSVPENRNSGTGKVPEAFQYLFST